MEVFLSSLGFDVWMSAVNGLPRNVIPPCGSKDERSCICNEEAMKAIVSGLTGDVPSQVDRCKSAKILWDRLKKLYENEPCTTESTSKSEKRFATDTCANDKGNSNCCSCNDDEETHLFMAHETDIEDHTSKGDNINRSHRYDVFDNKEEEGDKVNRYSR